MPPVSEEELADKEEGFRKFRRTIAGSAVFIEAEVLQQFVTSDDLLQ